MGHLITKVCRYNALPTTWRERRCRLQFHNKGLIQISRRRQWLYRARAIRRQSLRHQRQSRKGHSGEGTDMYTRYRDGGTLTSPVPLPLSSPHFPSPTVSPPLPISKMPKAQLQGKLMNHRLYPGCQTSQTHRPKRPLPLPLPALPPNP